MKYNFINLLIPKLILKNKKFYRKIILGSGHVSKVTGRLNFWFGSAWFKKKDDVYRSHWYSPANQKTKTKITYLQ